MTDERFTVKSRIIPTDFNTRISLVTDWLPVLGRAYPLYSMYLCLNVLQVEIGIRKIAKHLGVSHQTVHEDNRLLVLCGLVEILSGSGSQPNEVHLLEPPPCMARLPTLRAAVAGDDVLVHVRTGILHRIDHYKPLVERLTPYQRLLLTTQPAAAAVAGVQRNGNGNGHYNKPELPPNNLTRKILALAGVQGTNLNRYADEAVEIVLGHWFEALSSGRLENPAGYVVNRLKENGCPSPDFLEIAESVLRMSEDDYLVLENARNERNSRGEWYEHPGSFVEKLTYDQLEIYRAISGPVGQVVELINE